MLTKNQQMLTKIQQMLIVEEIHIFYCLIVSKCSSNVNYLLISQKRYLQLFLVRKIYVKMVKKTKNVKTSKIFFSVNSKDMMTWVCLDENMSPRSVLKTLSCSQTYYSNPPPSKNGAFTVDPPQGRVIDNPFFWILCPSLWRGVGPSIFP